MDERLRNKDRNLEILRELTTLLPTDTYLTTYTYRNGTIQLAGSSASAPKLIAELEKSPLLKDVTQKGGIFKEPQTGKDRFSFEAKVER
jgi:general secretion pathway protein L